MSIKSALDAEIATEIAAHLYAVARAEVDRLVAAGWMRERAILCVWASPRWPYADEHNDAKRYGPAHDNIAERIGAANKSPWRDDVENIPQNDTVFVEGKIDGVPGHHWLVCVKLAGDDTIWMVPPGTVKVKPLRWMPIHAE